MSLARVSAQVAGPGTFAGAPPATRALACPYGCHGLHLAPKPGGEPLTGGLLAAILADLQQARPQYRTHARVRAAGAPAPEPLAGREPPAGAVYTEALVCLYIPVPLLQKEDYWQLARHRRAAHSGPALWKMNLRELAEAADAPLGLAGQHLSPAEEAFLSQVQARRRRYLAGCAPGPRGAVTLAALRDRMREAGLPVSAGMPKGGLADALARHEEEGAAPLPGLDQLDAHQRGAIAAAVALAQQRRAPAPGAPGTPASPALLISAGPGSGKTTTVTNLVLEVARAAPGSRTLVLVFNVEAEATLKKRLARMGLRGGGQMIPKSQVFDPASCGCAVLTFDKMAYQVNAAAAAAAAADDFYAALDDDAAAAGSTPGSAPGSALSADRGFAGSFREGKERAAAALRAGAADYHVWDVVVVDEAQDVTPLEAGLLDGFLAPPRGARPPCLVAAGDPRQEVYPGATWYSRLWAAAAAAEGEPGAARRCVLSRNYRSDPDIVRVLNLYSAAAFPTLHHEQVAARPATTPGASNESQTAPGAPCGDDDTGDAPPLAVRVVEVTAAACRAGESLEQVAGRVVGGLLAARPAGESYALVPVTLDKFRLGEATLAARQTLHELRPAEYALALSGDARAPDDGVYLLATSRKIKGTEKPLVVVYGLDRDYDIVVDQAALAKLVYVALSRARDELVIVTTPLTTQRIKALVAPVLRAAGARVSSESVAAPRPPSLTPLPVTGEVLGAGGSGYALCQADYGPHPPWTVAPAALPAFPPIEARGDHDFVGCLAEAYLGQAVEAVLRERGCRDLAPALPPVTSLQLVASREKDKHGLYDRRDGDGRPSYILCTTPANRAALQELVDSAATNNKTSSPYIHAMLKFTALCGRPWTVSDRYAAPELESRLTSAAAVAAAALVDQVPLPGGIADAVFWMRGVHALAPCRPDNHGVCRLGLREAAAFREACVAYEVDTALVGATGATVPVEYKYVRQLTPEHERQLYSYMVMTGAAAGLLYNAATGEGRLLRRGPPALAPAPAPALAPAPAPLPNDAFMCRARAILALRTARSEQRQHFARHAIRPPPELARHTTLIALDAEADEKGQTTEIGAVAVSTSDWSVLGTFQARVPSARVTDADSARGRGGRGAFARRHIEELVGLARPAHAPGAAAESRALEAAFLRWCAEVTPSAPLYAHWAGSEKKLLGEAAATLDVYARCFVPWLELKQGGGAGQKLRDGKRGLEAAMEQLLPRLPFVAHQAFEDALAALAVFLVTVSCGGAM